MIFYAHYDPGSGEILGFYSPEFHANIPEPNIKLTKEQWKDALLRPQIVADGKIVLRPEPPDMSSESEEIPANTEEGD
jgi:hypothetical protein